MQLAVRRRHNRLCALIICIAIFVYWIRIRQCTNFLGHKCDIFAIACHIKHNIESNGRLTQHPFKWTQSLRNGIIYGISMQPRNRYQWKLHEKYIPNVRFYVNMWIKVLAKKMHKNPFCFKSCTTQPAIMNNNKRELKWKNEWVNANNNIHKNRPTLISWIP